MWLERVASKLNIADNPSRYPLENFSHALGLHMFYSSFREDYDVLHRLGAKRVEPRLKPVFMHSSTWEQLSVARSTAVKRRRKC